MDPQLLEALLAMLEQSGGSTAPTTAASTPATPAAAAGVPGPTTGSATPGTPTSPQFNYGTQQVLGVANDFGLGKFSSELASIAALLGIPTIGDLIGLPTEAKTQGLQEAALASGNPLDALIGRYIGRGVNAGIPLSQSGSSTFGEDTQRFAAMLEAITGQRAPAVTATGFQNNPTLGFPGLGKAADIFRLPAGYQFASDPSKLPDIFKDISGSIGLEAPGVGGKTAESEWQRVLRELIQQGAITKYQGPLGAVGGGGTSGTAIPNISLPHPLANTSNPAAIPAPYPV